MGSTRFPGKPLIDIGGKSMVMRVFHQAIQSSLLNNVVVATDDNRIAEHVIASGGKAVFTSHLHDSGTSRCAEVLGVFPDYDAVVNIQGDEPFIAPNQIDLIAELLIDGAEIGTLVIKENNLEELQSPNTIKVVLNFKGEAMYFSRSIIPFKRNEVENFTFFRHIGIYGFQANVLKKISSFPASVIEQTESLEQLRWLYNGLVIKTAITAEDTHSVDTPEDLIKLEKFLK